ASARGRWGLLLLPAAFVVGLLAFMGVRPLETRLATLGTLGAFADERVVIWRNVLAAVPKFPLFGCGYGTLWFVESAYRVQPYAVNPGDWGGIDHAHNDYVEALAEGGILRLAL